MARLFTFSLRNPGVVLAVSLLLAAASFYFASRLPVDTDIANLLPRDNPHVKAMHRLTETLGGEDRVEIIVAAGDFERNLVLAEMLADTLMTLSYQRNAVERPLFLRYELRFDTDIIRNNLLFFMNDRELSQLELWLDDIRDMAARRANPFFVDFDDEVDFIVVSGPDRTSRWSGFDLPPEYILNADSTALLFRLVPSGSKGDIRYVTGLFSQLDEAIAAFQPRLGDDLGRAQPSLGAEGGRAQSSLGAEGGRAQSSLGNEGGRAQSSLGDDWGRAQSSLGDEGSRAQIVYGGNLRNHLTKFDDINATLQFAVVFGISGLFIFLILYSGYLARRFVLPRGLTHARVRVPLWSLSLIIIIALSLGFSLLMTYAVAWFLFGDLNIMTTVLIAILLGVNLDYVLHFVSVFMERRSAARLPRALMETFGSCGRALLISCLTSCLAMLVLLYSGFRGFYEFGALFFAGILSTYIITISLFSVLMAWLDRVFFVRSRLRYDDQDSELVAEDAGVDRRSDPGLIAEDAAVVRRSDPGLIAEDAGVDRRSGLRLITENTAVDRRFTDRLLRRAAIPVFSLMGVLIIIAAANLPDSTFEYAFYKLEPQLIEEPLFRSLRGSFAETYRSDPAYFLFESPQKAREAAALLADSSVFRTVGHVESFHDRFPLHETAVAEKLERIANVRSLLENTLVARIISEWISGSDLDDAGERDAVGIRVDDERDGNLFQHWPDSETVVPGSRAAAETHELDDRAALKLLVEAASQRHPVELHQLPDFFLDRFTGDDGELVNLVVIYPNMMLADGRASIQFREDAGTVTIEGQTYAAASTALIGASILQIMQREAWWLMFLPLITAGMLLVLFFRSWTWGLLAFAPLVAGLVLLAGGMAFFGVTFNIYNIIVLPAVLGVGADNGVHLFHRLRELRRESVGRGFDGLGYEATPGDGHARGHKRGNSDITRVLKSTGVYVSASSVTTILGFAGLMFTGHPGLQSMGLVAVSGIGLTLICAMAFVIAARKLQE
jgi:uncharacterized protein